jgi:hypothetical protein
MHKFGLWTEVLKIEIDLFSHFKVISDTNHYFKTHIDLALHGR